MKMSALLLAFYVVIVLGCQLAQADSTNTNTSPAPSGAVPAVVSTAHGETWTRTDGKTYKNVTLISHDATVVTISSSDGVATFPISHLDKDLQSRVLADNVTAKDWTTSDGKSYKDVKVVKYDTLSVTILDADGGATVPLEKLAPDLQKKFGYDPVKAQALEKKQADDAIAAAKAEADAKKNQEAQEALYKQAVMLHAEVTQVLPNGVLADKMQSQYYDAPGSSLSDVGGGGGGGGLVESFARSGTIIFIQMPTDGVAEHQRITGYAVRTGTFTYNDINRASRTVEKWITMEPSASSNAPAPLVPSTTPSTASQFNPGSMKDDALKPAQ